MYLPVLLQAVQQPPQHDRLLTGCERQHGQSPIPIVAFAYQDFESSSLNFRVAIPVRLMFEQKYLVTRLIASTTEIRANQTKPQNQRQRTR